MTNLTSNRSTAIKIFALILAAAAVLGAWIYESRAVHAQSMPKKTVQIRWLIAHEPISLFDRASKDFVAEFNKDSTDMTISVAILGPSDYGSKNDYLDTGTLLSAMDSGQVQLGTAVVAGLAASSTPELGVMNLPYLFNNYASTEKVFDGTAGQQMLDLIDATTNEKALAFTFSGGFMVIESNTKKITSANDLNGLRIATVEGSVAAQTLDSFGAKAEFLSSTNGQQANQGQLNQYDGIETPYTRIFPEIGQKPKYIAETFHGLFTTAIMVNDTFYTSLSPADQVALQKAAQVAADDERADSIALGQLHRQELVASGTAITQLSTSSIDELKADGQSVYQKFESKYGSALVNEIETEQ